MNTWTRIAALLVLLGCGQRAALGQFEVLEVDPTKPGEALPPCVRPSFFAGWATPSDIAAFVSKSASLGLVRMTPIEQALTESTSFSNFTNLLYRTPGANQFTNIVNKGGVIVLTLARMPLWLTSNPNTGRVRADDDFNIAESSPPTNYVVWRDIVYESVKYFNNVLKLDVRYEVWNEPDLGGTWKGTRDEYLRLYRSSVEGARMADPNAKIGAPAVSYWMGGIPQGSGRTPPLISNLLVYAASQSLPTLQLSRLPVDFISWHEFYTPHGATFKRHADEVRGWLKDSGYPELTPLIVDEWQLSETLAESDSKRDSEVGAANAAASIESMSHAGIALQGMAALQDFESNSVPFYGGYGAMTRTPNIKKPSYHVQSMLSSLSFATNVPSRWLGALPEQKLDQLGCLAGVQPGRVDIMVWRYVPEVTNYFRSEMTDLLEEMAATDPQAYRALLAKTGAARLDEAVEATVQYISNSNLLANVPDSNPWKPKMRAVRERALAMPADLSTNMSVVLRVPGISSGSPKFERKVVDARHSNSYRAYLSALTSGVAVATAAAQAHQELELVQEGIISPSGELPPFLLEPFAVQQITIYAHDAGSSPYKFTSLFEPFDQPTTPPGWLVRDLAGGGAVWRFDNPGSRTNLTGGVDGFASADSALAVDVSVNTDLILPSLDLSFLQDVRLEFLSDFEWGNGGLSQSASVDVSVNGTNGPWVNALLLASAPSAGAVPRDINLTALAAGRPSVTIRFQYRGTGDKWWQVDDVRVSGSVAVNANDRDLDGLPDWYEAVNFGGPTNGNALADGDGDELNTAEEFGLGTSPLLADTDRDGYGDGFEVLHNSDPTNPNSLPPATEGDFDGDKTADTAVFVPTRGEWYVRRSQNGQLLNPRAIAWGGAADEAVAADYDGDRLTDVATYDSRDGTWRIRSSKTGQMLDGAPISWGWQGAVPVPADYDGDGRADIAVYTASVGEWYIRSSRTGSLLNGTAITWGWASAHPVPADYDGDGITDVGVYTPSVGEWYIRSSRTGTAWGGGPITWGWEGALPVPGDYNGDGLADIAVYTASVGEWYIRDSHTLTVMTGIPASWGWSTARPVPADYDGDGITDLGVYTPSVGEWCLRSSRTGHGLAGTPVVWGRYPITFPAIPGYQNNIRINPVP